MPPTFSSVFIIMLLSNTKSFSITFKKYLSTSTSLLISSPRCTSNSSRKFVGNFLAYTTDKVCSTEPDKEIGSASSSVTNLMKLRDILNREGLDAFIVPTDDPHMSEYTSKCYNRREFISGFTGSAGIALITRTSAILWTDGRYFTQAELELDPSNWLLMKQGLKDVPTLPEYLSKNFTTGSLIGIDPYIHSVNSIKKIEELLAPKNISLKYFERNLVDEIWGDERPAPPDGQIRQHKLEYAGQSVTDKLSTIRKLLVDNNITSLVVTALDEVCWLYNIRGTDIPCVPVVITYAIVTLEKAFLFIAKNKIPTQTNQYFLDNNIEILPYEDILSTLSKTTSRVWIDGKSANWAIFNAIPASHRVEKDSPIVPLKAKKNAAELQGMIAAHKRDGAAMVEFFSWLDHTLHIEEKEVSETEIDRKVCEFRRSMGMFLESSFPTIAGVESNGAIIHYRAEEGSSSCKMLGRNHMLLLDSGGQYEDGTTDVTRTIHTGQPSAQQIEMFTRVLKGNIGVDSAVFPAGTPGCLLDSFSRQHLWAAGLDFIHGTGHGVGASLSVHEGPHSISRVLNPTPLAPGMIVSNEPGFYLPGHFGIRIENLLIVVTKTNIPEFSGRSFLGFEKLTLIPIQKKLIDVKLLTPAEINWINTYHEKVWTEISPLLKSESAKIWLKKSTEPI